MAITVAVAATHYVGNHVAQHGATPNEENNSPRGTPTVGDLAPDFTLPDAHGEPPEGDPVTLSQLVEKGPVVMVYYLGYNCPRCVAHLGQLDDDHDAYTKLGAQIIAVGPGTLTELRDSIANYGDFNFPMLSDEKMKVARAYGLVKETPNSQSLSHGMYIIDKNRRIQFAVQSDHPYDDEEKLLAVLKSLQK